MPKSLLLRILICIATVILSIITLKELNAHFKLLIGVILTGLASWTLNQVAVLLAIVYSLMQIGLLVPQYIKIWKAKKNGGD
jgi:hypothetical protein